MICPACGRETARALHKCDHCGSDLHASSPICGTCPRCQLSVRESEIVCSNCGYLLEPTALKEAPRAKVPRQVQQATLWGRFLRALGTAVWPVRLLGVAVAVLGGARVYLYLDFFRLTSLYEQEIAMLGRALVWLFVFAAGVGIFVLSFSLKPEG